MQCFQDARLHACARQIDQYVRAVSGRVTERRTGRTTNIAQAQYPRVADELNLLDARKNRQKSVQRRNLDIATHPHCLYLASSSLVEPIPYGKSLFVAEDGDIATSKPLSFDPSGSADEGIAAE